MPQPRGARCQRAESVARWQTCPTGFHRPGGWGGGRGGGALAAMPMNMSAKHGQYSAAEDHHADADADADDAQNHADQRHDVAALLNAPLADRAQIAMPHDPAEDAGHQRNEPDRARNRSRS